MAKKPKDIEAIAAYADQYLEPGEDISEFLETLRNGKYNNNRNAMADGLRFDSELERDVYLSIKELKSAGVILAFKRQYAFNLKSFSGDVICKYVADFICKLPDQTVCVVEAKGMETAIWRLKKKFFLAEYPSVPLVMVKSRTQLPLSASHPLFGGKAKKTTRRRKKKD